MSSVEAMVVVAGSTGSVIERRSIPAPVRAAGQVLIEVRAASVNRADLAVRAGAHGGVPSDGPVVVGLDCAGVVLEADADSGLRPGDRVMTIASGGLAERVVVDARLPIRLPDAMSFEEGAASVLALLTGHNALRTAGRLGAGDTVFVNAALSGVGQSTVRLARLLGAGTVVAGVREVREEALLRELGADAVIATGAGEFADDLLAATDGQGVDVTIDHVGGPYLAAHVRAAAVGGRLVGVGRLGGAEGALDMEMLALKRLEIVGVTFRTRSADEKAAVAAGVRADLADALTAGHLTPVLDRVLPWGAVGEAQDLLERGVPLGKIVLTVPSAS